MTNGILEAGPIPPDLTDKLGGPMDKRMATQIRAALDEHLEEFDFPGVSVGQTGRTSFDPEVGTLSVRLEFTDTTVLAQRITDAFVRECQHDGRPRPEWLGMRITTADGQDLRFLGARHAPPTAVRARTSRRQSPLRDKDFLADHIQAQQPVFSA